MSWRINQVTVFMAAAMIGSVAEAQFNRVRLDSTNGRVGHHMSLDLWIDADDVPRGNSGGAASGTCRSMIGRFSYSGQLPPGIKLTETHSVPVFSGTPRQAGRWQGSLSFWARCAGGPDQNPYFRTVPVSWHIEP